MNFIQLIKDFIASSKRIFAVSKKPNKKEFFLMSKITGIGIILLGVIGFVIYIVATLFSLEL